jgi:hypothetical protein
MIVKGKFVSFDRPLVLRREFGEFPLCYEYRGVGWYVVKEPLVNPKERKVSEEDLEKSSRILEESSKFCDRIPEHFLMFPNFYPVGELFRRCDGVWIRYTDPLAQEIFLEMSLNVEMGGLPYRFDLARDHLRETFLNALKNELSEEEKSDRQALEELTQFCHLLADYMLGSAVAVGLFGPFRPSELGYEIQQPQKELDQRELPYHSMYAGSMALYETDRTGSAFHMLTSHAYRMVEVGNSDLTLLTVLNAYSRDVPDGLGALSAGRYTLAVDLAYEVERGNIVFLDCYPEPAP